MRYKSSHAREELRAAWDDMIQSLQDARNAIDTPALMPAPASDRNLAEGYRYLMGFVHSAVERAFHEDPARPHFRNALSIITRGTVDNADAIYFYAPIDGRNRYLIRGKLGDARHWRGESPAATGRKAPHYLILEANAGDLAGDSGDLAELRPGMKTRTGQIDSSSIEVSSDGSFEILLAPTLPEGYTGNFIPTLKTVRHPHPSDPSMPPQRYANYISGRQLFNDWQREEAIHFEISQWDICDDHSEPYCPATAAAEIRRFGAIVRNQMHFWNAFWTIPMGTYGEREGSIPGVAFPRNAFNKVNAASGATGGGMSTNLYAGGVFELEPDEALIIENRIALKPQYLGFQVANLWGESMEYANRTGSLNGHQIATDPDDVIRIVLAHADPGVPNWIDISGQREGFMTARWAYSQTPAEPDWPTVVVSKVPLADIRAHLPESTAFVNADERREQISIRQRHVQRRYRVF